MSRHVSGSHTGVFSKVLNRVKYSLEYWPSGSRTWDARGGHLQCVTFACEGGKFATYAIVSLTTTACSILGAFEHHY